MMAPRTRASVKFFSLLVWSVCIFVVAIHGGCGGGTSGTGVKALVTGAVEGQSSGTVDLVDEAGAVVATVALNSDGTWSANIPDGTVISGVAFNGVNYPTTQLVFVSAAVTTTLYTEPDRGTTEVSQVENTPTPTPTSGGGADPTATPNSCEANPNRPACLTPTPEPTSTRPPRATATPTIDPTAYCADHPNRPACATPTPTPSPTNTPRVRPTATPTIDPTAYCQQFPNRPACATPTPTPTPQG